MVGFLLVAAVIGAAAGMCVHMAAAAGGATTGMLCVTVGMIGALWPLAWVASMRIAWPMQRLASMAGDLKRGELGGREQLAQAGSGEVGEVASALRGMADRVAKQLKDQRALLAAVSHELRSPLGRVRVLVEMSREGVAPASFHDDVQGEIEAMDGLVGDLLAAARIDFEAITLREIRSEDLARRALEVGRVGAGVLDIQGDVGVVRADVTLMARALATLLDNGARYGGKVVRLGVRARETRVRFEVEDDGPGFAPGDEVQAFEPFWRGPQGEGRQRGGEGLGLALVRQIAEAHEGEAGAENRAEGGARVWVELPRG